MKLLVVEAELHDVAVVHDVVLALNASLALGASLSDGASRDEVVEADDLSLDETLLEVSVNNAGSLRCLGALRDRPRASLFRTSREIRLQAKSVEADAGELVETTLFLTRAREKFCGILLVEVDKFGLQLGVEEDRLRAGGDLRRRTLAVEARYHRVPADSDLSTGRRHAYTCRVGSIR